MLAVHVKGVLSVGVPKGVVVSQRSFGVQKGLGRLKEDEVLKANS